MAERVLKHRSAGSGNGPGRRVRRQVEGGGIDPSDVIAGTLPRRQQLLAGEWAELRQAELMTGAEPE